MEKIKKTILQKVSTEITEDGIIIVPDLTVTYYLKIGLKQLSQDLGFHGDEIILDEISL